MFMRNRLARKMAAEMREATCAGTQTSKAPTVSGPSVTNHYSVVQELVRENLDAEGKANSFADAVRLISCAFSNCASPKNPLGNGFVEERGLTMI